METIHGTSTKSHNVNVRNVHLKKWKTEKITIIVKIPLTSSNVYPDFGWIQKTFD